MVKFLDANRRDYYNREYPDGEIFKKLVYKLETQVYGYDKNQVMISKSKVRQIDSRGLWFYKQRASPIHLHDWTNGFVPSIVVDVTLSDDALVIVGNDGFQADKIIVANARSIRTVLE